MSDGHGTLNSSPPADVLAGIALGLFVGALIGLSASAVVGAVIGGLVTVMTTFFGLAQGLTAPLGQAASARIAAFCIAGLIATPIALYVRTHDLLSPQPAPSQTMKALADELRELKFPEEDVRKLIQTRYFGASPGTGVPADQHTHSTLFSVPANDCNEFSKVRNLSVPDQLSILSGVGGKIGELAGRVNELPESDREKNLAAGRALLCGQ